MGCVQSKKPGRQPSTGSLRQRRHSWHMRCLNRSMRMSPGAGGGGVCGGGSSSGQTAPVTPQMSQSRRSSVANMSKAHAVCPELGGYDYNRRADNQQPEQDDYLSQMDCLREQKRNEFEDYGTSPHLTLGAYDRLEFDMTPMENKQEAFF